MARLTKWIGGPWRGFYIGPRPSEYSPFDLDASERYTRPASGIATMPMPSMIGAVQGVMRTFDNFTLSIAKGKNASGPISGGIVPAPPFVTAPLSLAKREG